MNDDLNLYARWQPIYDVIGRKDYLTNPDRQENLLAISGQTDLTFWRNLSADAQQAWRESGGARTKPSKKNATRNNLSPLFSAEKRACEALEIQLALPSKILAFPVRERQELLDNLVQFFKLHYGLTVLAAMHLSKTDNNVHAHILYTDRLPLTAPRIKIASRNIFLDEHGIRKRTRSEILDDAGHIRTGCRIIPKGSVIHTQHFDKKDAMLSDPTWIHVCKEDLAAWINDYIQPDRRRTLFEPSGPYLAQEHIGRGISDKKKTRIKAYNACVQAFNKMVFAGEISEFDAHQIKTRVLLSPQRTSALGNALSSLRLGRRDLRPYFSGTPLANVAASELERISLTATGGIRTQADPMLAAKEQLRGLYREAEHYRQLARSSSSDVDRQIFCSKARQYSMLIDRQRRQLGLFTDEDYKKKIDYINDALGKASRFVSARRSAVSYAYDRIFWKKREIQELESELNNLPVLFKTKLTKQREQQLQNLIRTAKSELEQLEDIYHQKYAAYYMAKKTARAEKKELVKDRKILRAERKSIQDARHDKANNTLHLQ